MKDNYYSDYDKDYDTDNTTFLSQSEEEQKATTYKLTKDERETLLNYCEADGYWEIDTSVATHIRKFDKLGYECTDTQLYPDGTVMAKTYKVPKHAISFRKPEKVKREMSEEQKAAMSERVKLMQAARKK